MSNQSWPTWEILNNLRLDGASAATDHLCYGKVKTMHRCLNMSSIKHSAVLVPTGHSLIRMGNGRRWVAPNINVEHLMDESGQLDTPATLTLCKESQVWVAWKTGLTERYLGYTVNRNICHNSGGNFVSCFLNIYSYVCSVLCLQCQLIRGTH